jgi:hypothetical protein
MQNDTEPQILEIEWLERWQVYHRLKELEIECFCQSNQPLKVNPTHPQAVIQIWSVTKQFTATRLELIHWLNQCWQINIL